MTSSIEERFALALQQLVDMCIDAGMHPKDMVGPLKAQLSAVRHSAMPFKEDEDKAEVAGFARANFADLRAVLLLEPHETLPPLRTRV